MNCGATGPGLAGRGERVAHTSPRAREPGSTQNHSSIISQTMIDDWWARSGNVAPHNSFNEFHTKNWIDWNYHYIRIIVFALKNLKKKQLTKYLCILYDSRYRIIMKNMRVWCSSIATYMYRRHIKYIRERSSEKPELSFAIIIRAADRRHDNIYILSDVIAFSVRPTVYVILMIVTYMKIIIIVCG